MDTVLPNKVNDAKEIMLIIAILFYQNNSYWFHYFALSIDYLTKNEQNNLELMKKNLLEFCQMKHIIHPLQEYSSNIWLFM